MEACNLAREAPFSNGIRPVVLLMHGLFGDSSNSVMNPPTTSPGDHPVHPPGVNTPIKGMYLLTRDSMFGWVIAVEMPTVDDIQTQIIIRMITGISREIPFRNLLLLDDFRWYDHAHIDLPDTVDYILDYTGERSIYYVGHSQGTIIMFAKLAEDNGEFAKKV